MKQVTVLGAGPGNPRLLTGEAHEALAAADLGVGAGRLLAALPAGKPGRRCLPATRPADILALLSQDKGWQTACVAMSGDIGLFSGARGLLKGLEETWRVHTIPGISAVQYFAARLGRPWQGWHFESAHGVACDPAAAVRRHGEVFFVTGGDNTVASLCGALCAAGLGEAIVHVGENLSYPDERIGSGTAAGFAGRAFAPLSVMLVEYQALKVWEWAGAGIPDGMFARGSVPMTKQEVRAVALAKLRVAPADTVYDVGAGTGSVSVELALLAKSGRVYAIERKPEAVALIRENTRRFHLSNLLVAEGHAPQALKGLPPPQAVFLGGSGGQLASILAAVRAANPCVRVCVACVTLETLAEATRLLGSDAYRNFDASQIAVSRSQPLGGYTMLKAHNPVFLVSAEGVGA